MTVRHTPAPWRVNPNAGEVRGADWNVIVADVFPVDGDVDVGHANARLIAAAPDLLALAEAVIATAPMGSAAWGRLLRMAHVAHALATGEASRERT